MTTQSTSRCHKDKRQRLTRPLNSDSFSCAVFQLEQQFQTVAEDKQNPISYFSPKFLSDYFLEIQLSRCYTNEKLHCWIRNMLSSEGTITSIKYYTSQIEMLLKDYVLAEDFIIYASVLLGILACKTVYDVSRVMSPFYFKSYSSLSRLKQIEWNNRAMSTFHAVFITTLSLYFILWSDLYSDDPLRGPLTLRYSKSTTFVLGVSLGYFLSDFSMIIWFYPRLGGIEYVIHHLLSLVGAAYTMSSGEAQFYAFLVLASESTTPEINLRWYLDAAGMKRSKVYIVNGVLIFVAWLVARILLFVYLFCHAFQYYDQVMQMRIAGVLLVLVAPIVLSVMNLIWFWKISKGLKKTLAKRE